LDEYEALVAIQGELVAILEIVRMEWGIKLIELAENLYEKWLIAPRFYRYVFGLAFLLIAIVLGAFSVWFYISDLDFRSRVFLMLSGTALSIGVTLTLVDLVIKADRGQQWKKVKSLTYETIMGDLIILATLLPSCFGSARMTFDYTIVFGEAINKGFTKSGKEISDVIFKMAKAMNNEVGPEDIEEGWDEVFLSKWQEPLEESTIEVLRINYDLMKWSIQEMRNILIPRVLQLSDDQEVNAALLHFERDAAFFEHELMMNNLGKKDILVDAETIINLLKRIGKLYELMGRRYSRINLG
jgi:hypothetical protein